MHPPAPHTHTSDFFCTLEGSERLCGRNSVFMDQIASHSGFQRLRVRYDHSHLIKEEAGAPRG